MDICLDYIACWNPYLSELDQLDPELTAAFLRVMKESSCFSAPAFSGSLFGVHDAAAYQEKVRDFRDLLVEILTHNCTAGDEKSNKLLEMLSRYFSSFQHCKTVINNLKERIEQHGDQALKPILEAVPFWNMPHAPSTSKEDHIQKSIRRVGDALQQLQTNVISPPFLITIARSSCDGFTPAAVVEDIQASVLEMLHRVFCMDCQDRCSLRITKDYGEWEGSTI
jgi:hypothetical protein